jgi:hypothetical protein
MDKETTSKVPLRSSEDVAGEGMWRLAGESSPECWNDFTEDQKQWWRDSALHAARDWLARFRWPL